MSQENNHKVPYQTSILTPLNPDSKPASDTKYKELLAENIETENYKSGTTIHGENLYEFYNDLYNITEYYYLLRKIDFKPCRFILTIKDNDGIRGISVAKIVVDGHSVPENSFEFNFRNKDTLPFFLRLIEEGIKFRINEIDENKLSQSNLQYIERQIIDSNNIIIHSHLLDMACQNIDNILRRFLSITDNESIR
jgi:hypothetical protein